MEACGIWCVGKIGAFMLFICRNHKGQWYKSRELPDPGVSDRHGLIAFGGAYTADCFITAYRRGIFPWPCGDASEPIPWFCPENRFVLDPAEIHVSHSLRRTVNHHRFEICADRQFESVIRHCSTVKRHDDGTWINEGMISAFCELHRRGIAHSIESYADGELVGGFYGTCLGHVFGGESMFTLTPDASKVALVVFARRCVDYGIRMIDCQCYTDNMARYGAHEIPRASYLDYLERNQQEPVDPSFWDSPWQ